jgi:hypothetical protein
MLRFTALHAICNNLGPGTCGPLQPLVFTHAVPLTGMPSLPLCTTKDSVCPSSRKPTHSPSLILQAGPRCVFTLHPVTTSDLPTSIVYWNTFHICPLHWDFEHLADRSWPLFNSGPRAQHKSCQFSVSTGWTDEKESRKERRRKVA